MEQYYSAERNVQIVVSLLKMYGIKRVIVSPGSTNVTFVGSIQQDSFFEIYSCVDERSAAYMACGMAAETQEPVVLSCTGATASRNYYSALTEAFYRKLPIVAITSTQDIAKIGNMICQVIDRTQQPKDVLRYSVHLQNIKDKEDERDCELKVNRALLELDHHGMGPVHINLSTTYSSDYSVKELPYVRKIIRVLENDCFPDIPKKGKICIYAGSHFEWSRSAIESIDKFCEIYNSVVFADITSNYNGKYGINYQIALEQHFKDPNRNIDLLIHIGEMADFAGMVGFPKQCWRVNEDGNLCDRYGSLTAVFEMSEYSFFNHYNQLADSNPHDDSYLNTCVEVVNRLRLNVPELPFSHIWIAQQLSSKIPVNSCVHLGILSPLRSWSYWPFDKTVRVYCNQGGFGIDGNLSSLIGASLVSPDTLYYGIVGDLSFFYDLNSLGNRHVAPNVRILLVNNSKAAEFHLSKQENITCIKDIDSFMSAAGHFGRQSSDLVRHYATDLGFEYISASNKDEFFNVSGRFVSKNCSGKPMLFEVFTRVDDEDEALKRMCSIEKDTSNGSCFDRIKSEVKCIIGNNRIEAMKTLIRG